MRNGFSIKKAKSQVIRLVYSYIKRRCLLAERQDVKDEAKAALNKISKDYDTNNRRKIKSSADLLFLSYAYGLHIEGKLAAALADEKYDVPKDVQADVHRELKSIFTKIHETEKTNLAKTFRENLPKHILNLAASKHNECVCLTAAAHVCYFRWFKCPYSP